MSDELRSKILTETVGKFNIFFTPLVEYTDPLRYLDFENEEQKEEYIKQLDDGDICIFCARITVEVKKIELSSNYLGMCEVSPDSNHYDYKDFYLNLDGSVKTDDYYDDMKNEAIEEAKKTLKSLIAA